VEKLYTGRETKLRSGVLFQYNEQAHMNSDEYYARTQIKGQ
jgi:hypothetical protein